MVGSPCPWHVRNVGTSFATANVSTRVAPRQLQSVIQEQFQVSRVAPRRHTQCLARSPSTHSLHLVQIASLPRISSQSIHTTSTFELNSIASELVEDRSTSTAERDGVASVAHLSHRDNRPLQSSVSWVQSESHSPRSHHLVCASKLSWCQSL